MNTSELKETGQNTDNRTETGQSKPAPAKKKGKLAKTHQDYWASRLRKRSYLSADGKTEVQIPTWQVRLFHVGREGWFNLGTPNQSAACVKARDTYVFLKANGWDAAIAKFKPESNVTQRVDVTIGDFLNAVKNTGKLRIRTFLNYQNCFRTIIREVLGIKADKSRFDYRRGGNKKWAEELDAIRLERLSPACITDWQQQRLKKAGNSPVAIASAKRTANTYVRCARSLFSREIRKVISPSLLLPPVLPFEGIELFDAGSTKYISKMNAPALIAAARTELKTAEPEVYKAFLLALFAGMRKAEIDSAEWSMVDFDSGNINLQETKWLHLKSNDSTGQIAVDAELLAELREMKSHTQGSFILMATRPPRNDSPLAYYRCEPVFDRLNEWLRSKGVTANKPVHELRKEIGAMIATEHGIYAASRFLRHSDITTTARHYAQHKTRITVGLGKLLDTEIKLVVVAK